MELKFYNITDDFSLLDNVICYDDKSCFYDVYISRNTHILGITLGHVLAIVDHNNEVLAFKYPLMSAPLPYKIVEKAELKAQHDLYVMYNYIEKHKNDNRN